jgi:hypothetical protein
MARKFAKKHTVRRRCGGDDGPKYPVEDGTNKIGNPTIAFPPMQIRKPTAPKGGRTKRRGMRGGYYGFDGALATGAANWGRSSEMGGFVANSSRGGNNAILGAGRRRKSKKASRRTRRKMRGGGKYGGVSASFGGEGVAGLANYHGVTSRDNPGVPTGGKFNNYGAGPSSGFGSFVKAV